MTFELHGSDVITVILSFLVALITAYIAVRLATRALADTVIQEIERHRAEIDRRQPTDERSQ